MEELWDCFPKGLHHVTPQLVRVLPALVLWRCESSHPGACEVGSHCGFDLLFPADDVEHLFLYSPAMCLSSLEKGLFRSFAHFSIVFFAFLLLGCKHSFHILDPTLLSDVWFAKNFLPLWEVPSRFLDDAVHSTKVLNLMNSCLSNFFSFVHWCHSKKSLSNSRSERFVPVFS